MELRCKKMYFIAKIVNWITNRKSNLFLSLSFVGVTYLCITKQLLDFILLEALFLLLSCHLKRVGKVLVYFSIGNKLSMNLEQIDAFKGYDYNDDRDRKQIESIFVDEFTKGVLCCRINKMVFHTHRWVLTNVLLSSKIADVYDISYKALGKSTHKMDILLLSSGKKTNNMHYKRQNYKVVMRLKKKG